MASHIRLLRTNFVFLLRSRPPLLSAHRPRPAPPATYFNLYPSVQPRPSPAPLESHQRNYQPRKRGERNATIPSLLPFSSARVSSILHRLLADFLYRSLNFHRSIVGRDMDEFAPLNPRNEFALSIFIRPSAFKFRLVTLTPISSPIYKKLDTTTRPSLNFDNWSQMKAAGFRLLIVFRYSQERARVQGPLATDRPLLLVLVPYVFHAPKIWSGWRERERGRIIVEKQARIFAFSHRLPRLTRLERSNDHLGL